MSTTRRRSTVGGRRWPSGGSRRGVLQRVCADAGRESGSVRDRTRGRSGPGPLGQVTLTQGVALYVGAVLGAGVIALPALAARVAGPASVLAWLGLVVLSAPLAGCPGAALAGPRP